MIARYMMLLCLTMTVLTLSGNAVGQQVTMKRLNPVGQFCEMTLGSSLQFQVRFGAGAGAGYIKWDKAKWYVNGQLEYTENLSYYGFDWFVESTFLYEGNHPGTDRVSVEALYYYIGIPYSSDKLVWTVTVIGKETLMVSSTDGGSVTLPGEGTFEYDNGAEIIIVATPDDGYHFTHWTGSISSTSNPLSLTMDKDYDLTANFEPNQPVITTLYVDDNAPSDPCWYDPSVSDPDEDGSSDHPFDMIAEAIDVSVNDCNIIVREGRYYECINFAGKNILLTTLEPNDPNQIGTISNTIIDANKFGTTVTFVNGEDANCVLTGFVITGGFGQYAGAIDCNGSSPTISNCLIVGNRALDPNSAAIYCVDSNAFFMNCTISGNNSGLTGSGLYFEDCNAVLTNSIIWDNTPYEIVVGSGQDPNITFCDIAGGWFDDMNNIDIEPCFALPGYWVDPNDPNLLLDPNDPNAVWIDGDYHLMSEHGRWDHNLGLWILDDVTSPCIDAGNPDSDWTVEPLPNGERINIGAYGGTAEASMSLSKDGNSAIK
jgi:hypothetical protein